MDDSPPTSELEILKRRGLSSTPEEVKPSPPEAGIAGRRYRAALQEFDQALAKIRSYEEQLIDAAGALSVQYLIDAAMLAAADVRSAANGLAQFPSTFIPLDLGVAYFGEIAQTSEQAYRQRVSTLKKLRVRYHLLTLRGPASPVVPLSAHENVLRGWHLLDRHVDILLDELLKRTRTIQRVSAFFERDTAETAAVRLLEYHFDEIEEWLTKTNRVQESFTFSDAQDVGFVLTRSRREPQLTKHLKLVLVRDPSLTSLRFPDGFRIKTGYPILDDEIH